MPYNRKFYGKWQELGAFDKEVCGILKELFPPPAFRDWGINRRADIDGAKDGGKIVAAQVKTGDGVEWLDVCEARADQPDRLIELLRSIDPSNIHPVESDFYPNLALRKAACKRCGSEDCIGTEVPVNPETLVPTSPSSGEPTVPALKVVCYRCGTRQIQRIEGEN